MVMSPISNIEVHGNHVLIAQYRSPSWMIVQTTLDKPPCLLSLKFNWKNCDRSILSHILLSILEQESDPACLLVYLYLETVGGSDCVCQVWCVFRILRLIKVPSGVYNESSDYYSGGNLPNVVNLIPSSDYSSL